MVWGLLALGLIGFGSVMTGRFGPSRAVKAQAVGGLVLVSLVLHAVPHARGYEFFGRGDNATYLGILHSMLASGQLIPDDFYPGASLIAYQVVAIAGIPIGWMDVVGRLIPMAAYGLGSVVLLRSLLGTRQWDAFAITAAVIPVAGAYTPETTPVGLSVALTPLAVATLLPDVGATALGRRARTVLLVSFAFIHPLGCLILLAIAVLVRLVDRSPSGRVGAVGERRDRSTGGLLLAVSLAAWITPSVLFERQLSALRDAIVTGIFQSPGEFAVGLAGRARLEALEFVTLPLATNIGVVSGAVLGVSACVWALTVQRERWSERSRRIIILLGIEVGLATAFLVSLVAPVHLDIFRFVHFNAIIIPVLLAATAAVVGARRSGLASALVIGVGLVSIPFLYSSPLIRQPTEYVPSAEIHGVRWLLAHNEGAEALPVTTLHSLTRDVDLAVGRAERARRSEVANPLPIPDHFGADARGGINIGNDRPTVLTVSRYDVDTYTGVWGSAERFNERDFVRLGESDGVSRVYTNDAIDIYVVDVVQTGSRVTAR
jgi:hypothetical protein